MFGDAPFSRVTAHVAWRADGQKVGSGQDLFSFQPERRGVVTRGVRGLLVVGPATRYSACGDDR